MLHPIWQFSPASVAPRRYPLISLALCSLLIALTLLGAKAPTQTIPAGWRAIKDSSGVCRAAVPRGWVEGKDFSLIRETAGTLTIHFRVWTVPDASFGQGKPGHLPPGGKRSHHRARVARMNGSTVCAVQMERDGAPFTRGERANLHQVGATLEVVQ